MSDRSHQHQHLLVGPQCSWWGGGGGKNDDRQPMTTQTWLAAPLSALSKYWQDPWRTHSFLVAPCRCQERLIISCWDVCLSPPPTNSLLLPKWLAKINSIAHITHVGITIKLNEIVVFSGEITPGCRQTIIKILQLGGIKTRQQFTMEPLYQQDQLCSNLPKKKNHIFVKNKAVWLLFQKVKRNGGFCVTKSWRDDSQMTEINRLLSKRLKWKRRSCWGQQQQCRAWTEACFGMVLFLRSTDSSTHPCVTVNDLAILTKLESLKGRGHFSHKWGDRQNSK